MAYRGIRAAINAIDMDVSASPRNGSAMLKAVSMIRRSPSCAQMRATIVMMEEYIAKVLHTRKTWKAVFLANMAIPKLGTESL